MDISSSPFAPAGISSGPANTITSGNSSARVAATAVSGVTALFGEDGLNFFDLLDAINPLHHIPIISTIYRRLTGDDLSIASRLAGGALFGGAIGLSAAAFNAILEASTGKDLGEQVASAIFDGAAGGTGSTVMVAELAPRDAPWYLAGVVRFTAVAKQDTEPVNIATRASQRAEPPSPGADSRGERPAETADAPPRAQTEWIARGRPAEVHESPPSARPDDRLWYLAGKPPASVAPTTPAPTTPAPGKPAAENPEGRAPTFGDDLPWTGAAARISHAQQIDPVAVTALGEAKNSPAASSVLSGSDVDFAKAMMSGLDKYRAMARQQSPPPGRISIVR